MAKVTIWPDIYKEQGHWLPCVTLAKTLQGAGYTVEFMGIKDCESIVAPYHAPFRIILPDIYPQGHTFENKLEPLDQRWKPHHLLPITRGALGNVFDAPNRPELLVSGYFTGLETLLIHYKYDRLPFVIITTYLRHPEDDPAIHARTKLMHMPDAVARKLMDAVLPEAERGMSIEEFVAPLEGAQEIIPCPEELDFSDPDWVHRDQVTYVEPMIERASLTSEPVVFPSAEVVTVPEGKRLIYATSGSQVQDYEFQARQFFNTLIAMMQTQGMESYFLVIAAGGKLTTELRREYSVDVPSIPTTLPTNVVLREWVSQLDILGEAEVVFMHGGLATIKESIWEEVPIVIVPHGKDQIDNALRIKRAGIGLVSEVGELRAQDLRQLLTAATANTWIGQNLAKMKAIFALAEDPAVPPRASLTVISGVVPP